MLNIQCFIIIYVSLFITLTYINILLGLTDRSSEGQFVWKSDDSTSTYFNWAPSQPDNDDDDYDDNDDDDDDDDDEEDDDYEDSQDCVQLWSKFGHKWDDKKCNRDKCHEVSPNCKILALCQK